MTKGIFIFQMIVYLFAIGTSFVSATHYYWIDGHLMETILSFSILFFLMMEVPRMKLRLITLVNPLLVRKEDRTNLAGSIFITAIKDYKNFNQLSNEETLEFLETIKQNIKD